MSLKKTVVISSIGVPASHHVIRRLTVDLDSGQTTIEVASYYDAEVAQRGAQSIGIATVVVDAIPADGKDLKAFCERTLTEPMPANADEIQARSPNRFVLAGAEIVA
jgi:hypothetical protein